MPIFLLCVFPGAVTNVAPSNVPTSRQQLALVMPSAQGWLQVLLWAPSFF
jgi:hypothetical protein